MKKIVKRTLKIIFLFVIIALVIFGFSYISPGKIKPVDKVRLDAQTVFLKFLGESYVTDFVPYKYGEEEAKHLISYEELSSYLKQLNTGDVFFTASENYLCSEVTPGKWKHSVIYIGTKEELEEVYSPEESFYQMVIPYYETGEEVMILDGSKEGIKIRELPALSNLADYSYMNSCIGFSLGESKEEIKEFIEYATEQIGKEYDYDIDTDDDETLYCSELLYKSFLTIGVYVDKTTKMLARTAVSPSDLVDFLDEDNRFKEIFNIQKADGEIIEAD